MSASLQQKEQLIREAYQDLERELAASGLDPERCREIAQDHALAFCELATLSGSQVRGLEYLMLLAIKNAYERPVIQ